MTDKDYRLHGYIFQLKVHGVITADETLFLQSRVHNHTMGDSLMHATTRKRNKTTTAPMSTASGAAPAATDTKRKADAPTETAEKRSPASPTETQNERRPALAGR